MLFIPCRIMLGMPVRRMLPMSAASFVKLRIESFVTVFPRRNGRRRTSSDTYCETAVASPAPAVPRCRPKIRIGSRIMFRIPPEASPNIA